MAATAARPKRDARRAHNHMTEMLSVPMRSFPQHAWASAFGNDAADVLPLDPFDARPESRFLLMSRVQLLANVDDLDAFLNPDALLGACGLEQIDHLWMPRLARVLDIDPPFGKVKRRALAHGGILFIGKRRMLCLRFEQCLDAFWLRVKCSVVHRREARLGVGEVHIHPLVNLFLELIELALARSQAQVARGVPRLLLCHSLGCSRRELYTWQRRRGRAW